VEESTNESIGLKIQRYREEIDSLYSQEIFDSMATKCRMVVELVLRQYLNQCFKKSDIDKWISAPSSNSTINNFFESISKNKFPKIPPKIKANMAYIQACGNEYSHDQDNDEDYCIYSIDACKALTQSCVSWLLNGFQSGKMTLQNSKLKFTNRLPKHTHEQATPQPNEEEVLAVLAKSPIIAWTDDQVTEHLLKSVEMADELYYDDEDNSAALKLYLQALDGVEKMDLPLLKSRIHLYIGKVSITSTIDMSDDEILSNELISQAYVNLNKSLDILDDLIPKFRKGTSAESEKLHSIVWEYKLDACDQIAIVHLHRGDLEKANQYLERWLSLSQDIKDDESTAFAHVALAVNFILRSQTEDAELHIQKALSFGKNDEIINEKCEELLIEIEEIKSIPEIEHYLNPTRIDKQGCYMLSNGTKKHMLGELVKVPNASDDSTIKEEVLMIETFEEEECPECNKIISEGVILLTESCSILPAKCCLNTIYLFEDADSMPRWE